MAMNEDDEDKARTFDTDRPRTSIPQLVYADIRFLRPHRLLDVFVADASGAHAKRVDALWAAEAERIAKHSVGVCEEALAGSEQRLRDAHKQPPPKAGEPNYPVHYAQHAIERETAALACARATLAEVNARRAATAALLARHAPASQPLISDAVHTALVDAVKRIAAASPPDYFAPKYQNIIDPNLSVTCVDPNSAESHARRYISACYQFGDGANGSLAGQCARLVAGVPAQAPEIAQLWSHPAKGGGPHVLALALDAKTNPAAPAASTFLWHATTLRVTPVVTAAATGTDAKAAPTASTDQKSAAISAAIRTAAATNSAEPVAAANPKLLSAGATDPELMGTERVTVRCTGSIHEHDRDAYSGLYRGVEALFAAAWPVLSTEVRNWRPPKKGDGYDDPQEVWHQREEDTLLTGNDYAAGRVSGSEVMQPRVVDAPVDSGIGSILWAGDGDRSAFGGGSDADGDEDDDSATVTIAPIDPPTNYFGSAAVPTFKVRLNGPQVQWAKHWRTAPGWTEPPSWGESMETQSLLLQYDAVTAHNATSAAPVYETNNSGMPFLSELSQQHPFTPYQTRVRLALACGMVARQYEQMKWIAAREAKYAAPNATAPSLVAKLASIRDALPKLHNPQYARTQLRSIPEYQVVVKAQKVLIAPGTTYKGLWHDEGLHERVIAVIVYYYSVPNSLVGGGIHFAAKGVDGTGQRTALKYSWQARSKVVVDVAERQLLVFSNYQTVHRVLEMRNDTTETLAREFVCLFVIDPRHPLPVSPPIAEMRNALSLERSVPRPISGGDSGGSGGGGYLPPVLVAIVLEYSGDWMSPSRRLAVRKEYFAQQMTPRQLGTFMAYFAGNGDSTVWSTSHPHADSLKDVLVGTSSEEWDEKRAVPGYEPKRPIQSRIAPAKALAANAEGKSNALASTATTAAPLGSHY